MTPVEATQAFQNGELKGFALMFTFAQFQNWQVAIDDPNSHHPQMKVFTDDKGERFVNIFENAVLYDAWVQTESGASQKAEFFLDTYGYAILMNLPEGLSYINLNPGTPEELHYRAGQFETLVQAGSAAYIDEHVGQMSRGQGNIQEQLHAIKNYNFDVVLINAGKSLAGAPDNKGRKLLALFTYEEAALKYTDWYKEQGKIDSPMITKVRGGDFCQMIAGQPFDGVVLNCVGPIGTQAFVPKVVELVNGLE